VNGVAKTHDANVWFDGRVTVNVTVGTTPARRAAK
jgi:hypothetical protein